MRRKRAPERLWTLLAYAIHRYRRERHRGATLSLWLWRACDRAVSRAQDSALARVGRAREDGSKEA
jgi:hypothetical protein